MTSSRSCNIVSLSPPSEVFQWRKVTYLALVRPVPFSLNPAQSLQPLRA